MVVDDLILCSLQRFFYTFIVFPALSNNLAVTPQPMTAALIFRRQLVRDPTPLLTASSERVQAATRKISSAAWPSFLGVNFGNFIVYHFLCFFRLCTGYHSTQLFYAGLAASWNATGGTCHA